MSEAAKWLERAQFIYEANKPLLRAISAFIAENPPPVRNCETGVYRKFISKMAFFTNCIYLNPDKKTNAEKNLRYDLAYFDLWQRLEIPPLDLIKERMEAQDVSHIRRLAEKYPEDEAILDAYAGCLSNSYQFTGAEEVLQKIRRLYPEKESHDALLTTLNICIRRDWDLEGAGLIADRGLLIYPDSFDFLISKAEILRWLGDETGCRDYLKKAEAIDRKRFRKFMKESWIDVFPEKIKEERFMQTLDEIMILISKNRHREAYALFDRAKRLCPNYKKAKKLLLDMEFDRAIHEVKLDEASNLLIQMRELGEDETTFFSEALYSYKKGDTSTALSKALESERIASRKKMRYFLPALELMERIYTERNDNENEKKMQIEIRKAQEYQLTRFRL